MAKGLGVPPGVASLIRAGLLALACWMAWDIRLLAVRNYGRVIHEFDPWFNFRATEYLVEHGWTKFSTWFDTLVWYPLGRPVGTTIYPGIQATAAGMYYTANALGFEVSLNDVCVFVPAVFGAFAVLSINGLAKEVTGSPNAGVATALLFSILPAHLMRSVAGGYDNESIAVTAIVLTFYLWCRSLRHSTSWMIFGPLAGISYVYMVAAWGGYVFVLNMVGMHALMLVLMGRYTSQLHRSFTIFMLIGTYGAMQFPVVGSKPLKDMEHMMPMALVWCMQVLEVCEMARRKYNMTPEAAREFRYKVFAGFIGLGAIVLALMPNGYFGPISNRVRSLFIKHTHTGNPLVDSVAEHQATKPEAYWIYFHLVFYACPFGFVSALFNRTDAKYFLLFYTAMSAYFSRKMVRLILILAPAASICAGMTAAAVFDWAVAQFLAEYVEEAEEEDVAPTPDKKGAKAVDKKDKKTLKQKPTKEADHHLSFQFNKAVTFLKTQYNYNITARKVVAAVSLLVLAKCCLDFHEHSHNMAGNLSEPQIMLRGRSREGETVIIDDFREAYWWLRDNTPEDARIMAWWDYGYQITGVGNRTSIADGNTWNHEHLALLGKCLVSEEEKSYKITRHLADYVLVWSTRYAGMWGDDLAKVPHIARIAGSVYSDIYGNGYYMESQNQPSPMLRNSLLYRLHGWRLNPSVEPLKHFEEVYTSKNMMVRIYKVKDVAKRHTFGEYPPWVQKNVVSRSKAYNQRQRSQTSQIGL
jgi:dolichyl-diphosphooligosaccharide--protein glycosyltransferase